MTNNQKQNAKRSGRQRRPPQRPVFRPQRMAPARRLRPNIRTNNDDARLLLSNLGTDISIQDINRQFSKYGKVAKVVVHLNNFGVSVGTAEVWFSKGDESASAKSRLNVKDIFDDGRVVRIERFKNVIVNSSFWKHILNVSDKSSTGLLKAAQEIIKKF
ncbi:uncharacterized protein LOC128960850 [Oppia nitens]|uniref:uncharacterized protein LOC128960850 n=1 Tax=Oppia nitens TaxID=1686743 RepID=UPI0023DA3F65|nr:uncharacterized protein LOC128960850 [Oppia nitens]